MARKAAAGAGCGCTVLGMIIGSFIARRLTRTRTNQEQPRFRGSAQMGYSGAMQSVDAQGVWSIRGPCEIDRQDPECATSSNYPNNYGNGESCRLTLADNRTRYLVVDSYDVEDIYDSLYIGGEPYVSSMQGSQIEDVMSWSSDSSVTRSGWRICARTTVTTSTTTTRTTTTRTALNGSWAVAGPCEVTTEDGMECVASPGYPEDYGMNQHCAMYIFGGVERYLEVADLDELSGWRSESLRMDGREVTHHLGGLPVGVVEWSSDALQSLGGTWKLCALEAPRQEAGTWDVQGPCEVDPADAECVTSPGFPGSYGEDEQSCVLSIYGGAARRVEVQRLEMDTAFPPLFMGGLPLSASRDGEALDRVVTWSSAGTGTGSIWKICARRVEE